MFCKKCGKELNNDVKFCDGCGAVLEEQEQANEQPMVNNQPPSSTLATDSSNKIIFVLSYLGVLFFLPLVVCPNSSVGKFHANQGLSLLIVSIGGSIAISILYTIISFLGFLSPLFSLVIFIFMIMGMVNAYNGKQVPLPIIGTLFNFIK